MDFKVKELIEKMNNVTKKTKVIAIICAAVTAVATLILIVAAKKHKAKATCDGNCDACEDAACCKNADKRKDDEDWSAITDGKCTCDGKCAGCSLNEDNKDKAAGHCVVPVGVVFMDSTNASMYEKASKCENYDSDFSGGRGNCSSNATSGEGMCEFVGANCMCVQCALNLANGGPCTHCQKCPGTPLSKNSEEEESEEVTE